MTRRPAALVSTFRIPSPLGPLTLVARAEGLAGVYMAGQAHAPPRRASWVDDAAPFDDVRRQLDEYFAGERTRFELRLAPEGTPFQRRVWEALLAIPHGETISYGELARRVGLGPGGARAAGQANARNPLSIVVPCHRVVGADGSLTGYAGGEDRKRWLLDRERAQLAVRYRSTMSVSSSAASRARADSSSASTAA